MTTLADIPLSTTSDDQTEFEKLLREATAHEEATPIPERYVDGKLVAWAPQQGSQEEFLSCPLFEVLYHGTRGGGKTDALLMDFARDVGKGYGDAWRGTLFRQTYPQLADVVAKSERWFRQIFPTATFNRQRMAWEWETGEVLLFRHMRTPDDYWNYHGHEIPWLGFEELTNWADQACYTLMFACCRSSMPGIPKRVRGTTNPYGVGHDWVKGRFRLESKWQTTKIILDSFDDDGNREPPRVAIHGHMDENRVLAHSDPGYKSRVLAAASNKAMRDAWEEGSWKLVAGGMFGDVWDDARNDVPDFPIPRSWTVDRAFDWGSSKPFSVGWYAQSDGTDIVFGDGRRASTVPRDLFRIREWYGFTGQPNQGLRMLAVDISEGIVERELMWGFRSHDGATNYVAPGPADSSIFTVEDGRSIAMNMEQPVKVGDRVYPGVSWTPADKRPGSRVTGWEQMRTMIKAASRATIGQPREKPALFVVGERCPQFLRTVLTLPRDEKNLDDVNTKAEDHIGDEVRYRVRATGTELVVRPMVGNY